MTEKLDQYSNDLREQSDLRPLLHGRCDGTDGITAFHDSPTNRESEKTDQDTKRYYELEKRKTDTLTAIQGMRPELKAMASRITMLMIDYCDVRDRYLQACREMKTHQKQMNNASCFGDADVLGALRNIRADTEVLTLEWESVTDVQAIEQKTSSLQRMLS